MFSRINQHGKLVGLITLGLLIASSGVRADDADLLAGAADRIEKNRKADVVIVVKNADGQVVPGAKVEIEQTRHTFLFGSNIFMWGKLGSDADNATYNDRFANLLNYATLPFYWPMYEPKQGEPIHEHTEKVAKWCREHGITTKGHPLAWNFAEPRWLPDDPEEVHQLQLARIDDCVGRFKGVIDFWDVVNEATEYERPGFRKAAPRITAMWDRVGREEFVLECLRHARGANPTGTFLVNDYRTDKAYEKLLKDLIEKSGAVKPFSVIGIQSHMHGGAWTNSHIWEVCERYAAFGLPIHFTETTIVSGDQRWEKGDRPWPSTPEGEKRQADEIERFYTMLFSHPAVAAITWWDFADRGAWKGAPAGFLRADLTTKPSYDRLHDLIKNKWWTRASMTTDEKGEAKLRAFLGEHKATVTDGSGKKVTVALSAVQGDNRIEVKLP